MPAKSNRLLMLLIGAAISGCASQTDRSSSSGSDRYQPDKESVQMVDRPLEDAPPPKPASVAAAAPKPEAVPETPPPPKPAPVAAAPQNEAVPEFPVTKYELPEEQDEEVVEDLGPQDDESISEAQETSPASDGSVGETTEYAEEAVEEEIGELGPQDDESISEAQEDNPQADTSVGETTEYAEDLDEDEVGELGPQDDESVSEAPEESPAMDSSVGETTEYAEEAEEDEVGELGPQEDESTSAEQTASPAGESTVGEATQYAEQEEPEVVEDLGTQPDESGSVHYPEEKRAATDRVVGEPKLYAEETAPKPKPVTPRSITVSFETEPLFGLGGSAINADQRVKLDELVSSLKGSNIESISVVGHADRIGGKAYNQKLSERRAESVNRYLASKGIQADRIHTEGRGLTEPVSGDVCRNVRGKKLITCLQPDRRVDVNVTATKQKD